MTLEPSRIPQVQMQKCKNQINRVSNKQTIIMDYKTHKLGCAFEIPQMQMPKVKSKIYTNKL